MAVPSRGFTLLEVMVVLVLVGILTSFALLSIGGGPHERLAEEARRLAGLMQLHQQEAILSGQPHGIQFSRTGYTVLLQNEKGAWSPPAVADTLIQHHLPEDIVLELWVEGQPVAIKKPGRLPQVLLLASGEATEFVIVFGFSAERGADPPLYRVSGDALGRLAGSAVQR